MRSIKAALILAAAIVLAIGVPAGYVAFAWLPQVRLDLRASEDRATASLEAARKDLALTQGTALLEAAYQAEQWRRLAEKRSADALKLAAHHSDEWRQVATDAVVMAGDVAGDVSQHANDALDRVDTQPLLAQLDTLVPPARDLMADSDRAIKLLTPQALGLTAAAKVTAGHAAQITREGAKVAPTIAQNTAAISTDTRKIVHRIASPWHVVFGVVKKIALKVVSPF